jgi:hypothetical protein
MRSLHVTFISLLAGVFSALSGTSVLAGAPAAADKSVAMPYADCLAVLDEAVSEAGEGAVDLVNTTNERSVRIEAEDGFVTVSCSRSRNMLTLTAVRQAAPAVTAAR